MNETVRSAWQALERRVRDDGATHMLELFAREPDRLDRMSPSAAGITLDLSKNRVSRETLDELIGLADAADVPAAIEALLDGAPVNRTEGRAALHTALRAAPEDAPEHVRDEIADVLARVCAFVERVRDGRWTGADGRRVTDVVNIGIGGSHLGPELVCDALRFGHGEGPRVHFLANVDGGAFDRIVRPLDPATTLFVVASKSFTTAETRRNAETARAWVEARFPDGAPIAKHFVAVSARPEAAVAFGIAAENVFPMWDWVGGRYSLWSAIGLPIALAVGATGFRALLDGAAEMDRHARNAPLESNLPVLFALVGVWNNNFLGAESVAVVPYDDRLRLLPEFLQQLDMESNGKRVTLANEALAIDSAPVTWGGVGTNAQHAFFQMLHQGTRLVPVEFVVALTHPAALPGHHDMLVANCLAQAEGLLRGRDGRDGPAMSDGTDAALHRACPGNRPSTVVCLDALTPATLGALLALYEHRTYVQSVLWGINAFDQWGVELGKTLAGAIAESIERGSPDPGHDPSTAALVQRYVRARRR